MPDLTTAEKLILVAFDAPRRRLTGGPEIYLGAAGAVIMDLVHDGAVEVRDGRVVANAGVAARGELLTDAADTIAAQPKPRDVKHWVRFLAAPRFRLGQKLLTSLVSSGVLQPVTVRWLGWFERERHVLANDAARTEVIEGVRTALLTSAIPDPALLSLIALLSSCGLIDRTVGREARGPARERASAIARGDAAGLAVSGVIAEVQAEVMSAVIVATIASTAVDSGAAGAHGH